MTVQGSADLALFLFGLVSDLSFIVDVNLTQYGMEFRIVMENLGNLE